MIFPLYFFSGFSALVYEIVWARACSVLALGTSAAAWAAVLAAYMGGMALGAAVGGRLTDRTSHPARFFALCEAGIGLFGAASPLLVQGAQNVFAALPSPGGASTALLRVIAAGGVLAVPTALMGATFPAASRILFAGGRPFGRALGALYSVNTLGGVAGCLAAGFVFLPALGMSSTLHLAAGVNCAVAAAALFAVRSGRGGSMPAVSAGGSEGKTLPGWLIPAVVGCSGFCALAFEVIWGRAIVLFLTSTTYAFTTVLSVMLLGLAAGGAAAARIGRGRARAMAWVGALQLAVGFFGFASPFFLRYMDHVVSLAEGSLAPVWWQWLGVRYLVCFIVIFPSAFCMGAAFPLAVGASITSPASAGRSVGSLLSLNTLCGIAGALAAAFLLIPAFGIRQSFVLMGAVTFTAGMAVMGAVFDRPVRITAAGSAAAAVLAFISAGFIGANPMVLYSRAVLRAQRPASVVSYREDASASVAVLQNDLGRQLTIDGFNAAGTYRYEYMHLLAHLPVLLSPSPDTVLVVCLGTGTTCGTAALYPSVKRVECVEISSAVIAAAHFFSDVNYAAADNPKVRIIADDGRNHLLRSRRRYDVITLEPMHPYLASATNLYSADFYRLCRQHLSAHGVMAQWAPLHMLSPAEYRMLLASFTAVFPHASLWFLGTEGVLIGTMDPLRIDIDALKRRMSAGAAAGDLAKISLGGPARLLSCFCMDERGLGEYAGGAPVIRDDLPRLEFSAPHNLVVPSWRLWRDNMGDVLDRRASVLPFVANADSADKNDIERCRRASTLVMKAGILNAYQQFLPALVAADSALSLMPGDTTALLVRRESAAFAALLYVNDARIGRSRRDESAAEAAYLQALAIDPLCAPACTELATLYNSRGMFEKGLEYAQKAVVSSPADPATHTNLAVVYMNLNRPVEAETELLRAVAIDKSCGRAYFFLGSLYRETGREAEGREAVKKAGKLGYRQN